MLIKSILSINHLFHYTMTIAIDTLTYFIKITEKEKTGVFPALFDISFAFNFWL